jgi:signal transduction histidine kinase
MSFVALMMKVPAMVFATIIVTLLIAFPAAIAWLAWTVRREPNLAALPVVLVMLIAITGYSLATTAFGDGIFEAERHNWLGVLATLAAVGMLPLVIWQLTRELASARIAVAAAFGVMLLATGWVLWTRHANLAIGALDRVVGEPARSLELTGWALDPWSVRRVYATVGGGPQTEGTRGIERHDLEAAYPGYPEAVSGGFRITLPPNAWRENEQMRVYVENRAGAITEIDRRRIRLRP